MAWEYNDKLRRLLPLNFSGLSDSDSGADSGSETFKTALLSELETYSNHSHRFVVTDTLLQLRQGKHTTIEALENTIRALYEYCRVHRDSTQLADILRPFMNYINGVERTKAATKSLHTRIEFNSEQGTARLKRWQVPLRKLSEKFKQPDEAAIAHTNHFNKLEADQQQKIDDLYQDFIKIDEQHQKQKQKPWHYFKHFYKKIDSIKNDVQKAHFLHTLVSSTVSSMIFESTHTEYISDLTSYIRNKIHATGIFEQTKTNLACALMGAYHYVYERTHSKGLARELSALILSLAPQSAKSIEAVDALYTGQATACKNESVDAAALPVFGNTNLFDLQTQGGESAQATPTAYQATRLQASYKYLQNQASVRLQAAAGAYSMGM